MTSTAENIGEIIKIVGPLVSTILVPYMAWRLRQVEKNTNSKMDEVLAQTRINSEKEGKHKEQDAQKARDAEK